MADLLLELFSEEIPARMQKDAIDYLSVAFAKALYERGAEINDNKIAMQLFVTPRRVAIWAKDLPAQQPDVTTELKGPKVDAPQAAMDGFLKKTVAASISRPYIKKVALPPNFSKK